MKNSAADLQSAAEFAFWKAAKVAAQGLLSHNFGPVRAVAAIDAPPQIVVSFQLFEGETSFESPAVQLAAGGEFRIR